MSAGEPAPKFSDELARVNTCMARYSEEYAAFMKAAQNFEWARAGAHQDRASGYLEAAMDAYIRACRIQESEVRKRA